MKKNKIFTELSSPISNATGSGTISSPNLDVIYNTNNILLYTAGGGIAHKANQELMTVNVDLSVELSGINAIHSEINVEVVEQIRTKTYKVLTANGFYFASNGPASGKACINGSFKAIVNDTDVGSSESFQFVPRISVSGDSSDTVSIDAIRFNLTVDRE